MHARPTDLDLRLPAMFWRPLLQWEWAIVAGRLTPVNITWSLVINILHAIIEILIRLQPNEPVDGAKADIADAVAKLWDIHRPKGAEYGESEESSEQC